VFKADADDFKSHLDSAAPTRRLSNAGQRAFRVIGKTLLVGAAAAALATGADAQAIGGRWDATVTVKDQAIPFRLDLTDAKGRATGKLWDGDVAKHTSSNGRFVNRDLHLEFASLASKLDAHWDGGVLKGTYNAYPFTARPHAAVKADPKAPPIAGEWRIPVNSPKGEKAWRFIVQQRNGEAYATILRIDGDTGTLNGVYKGGKYTLSRFAGERAGLIEATPQPDGSLNLVLYDSGGRQEYKAYRASQAAKAGVAAPSDPTRFTTVANKSERFRFSGTELKSGKAIDQADPRFKGKVVLVNLTGSWCPNCHDEAPFLAALDAKYRARGLQIVGLDFEDADQIGSGTPRLKAFINRYKLNYTYLLAGERKDVNQRLPQAVNLNAWPTSFFVGRDGRVKSVHVGFPSRGSAQYDAQARAQISKEIEQLLAEKA
jgi:thiol-disulfide isomerase/thioredoxin